MSSSSNYLKNRKNKTIIQNLIDGIKNGDYIYDKFSFSNDKFIIKDLELRTNTLNTDDLTVPTLKTNQIIFNKKDLKFENYIFLKNHKSQNHRGFQIQIVPFHNLKVEAMLHL